MNIIEAIKSGKPFKRKDSEGLMTFAYFITIYLPTNKNHVSRIKEDLIADDYEVEEEKVEVTKELALRILRDALERMDGHYETRPQKKSVEVRFLKELGFKP